MRLGLSLLLPLLPLLPLSLGGCGNDLPVSSSIDKLRVLAMRAEPPEAAPGEAVALDALVVEPPLQQLDGGAPQPVSWLWLACAIAPGSTSGVPCGLGAERPVTTASGGLGQVPLCSAKPDAPICLLGTDPTAGYTPPASLLGAQASAQILIALTVADSPEGAAGCLIAAADAGSVPQNPDHCVFALKRVTVSARTPEARNHNPSIEGFALSERGEDPAPPSLLDGSASYVLSPDKDAQPLFLSMTRVPGSSETDRRADPTDTAMTPRMIDAKEALAVSWFATGGKFDGGRSTFAPPDCASQADCPSSEPVIYTRTKWLAPTAEMRALMVPGDGVVRFYVVLRDDRGGATWQTGSATLR